MKPLSVKVGDWVRMYDPGIWRVSRVLRLRRLDPLTGRPERATLIFGNRFVTNSFKRSFSGDSCDIGYVRPLTKAQAGRLRKFIDKNPDLYEEFNQFEPEPTDSIYNAKIAAPRGMGIKAVEAMLRGDREFTQFEIEPWLRKHGLSPEGFPTWTVQLVSPGHKVKNGCLTYRCERVLKF